VMPDVNCTARKLKVTVILDPGAFASLRLADQAPSRSTLRITVAGRMVTADVATKVLRKAKASLAEHGQDAVVLLLQGTLEAGDRLIDAGLSAQVKVKAEAEPAKAA
jgi:hypothetical protein